MFGGGLQKLSGAFGDRGTRAMLGAQMMAAPTNRDAFAALGQGMAFTAEQQRELAERKKKIDYLRSMSNTNPQVIGAVENNIISPEQAFQSMTTPVGGPKPTSAMQNYLFAQKNDGYDGSFMDYQSGLKKAGAQNVTVNNGAPSDSGIRKKLNEKTGEQWASYQSQGALAASLQQDFAALDALIDVAPQGALEGRLAAAFPGFNSAGEAFESIVKRVAPTLRVEGSGSTSDIEYAGMLKSLPALQNTPEGNRVILQIMRDKSALNIERAEVSRAYATGQITAQQAFEKMGELDSRSIISPELQGLINGLPQSQRNQNSAAPKGIDSELWNTLTPEEKALWN